MSQTSPFDLDAYLRRVRYGGDRSVTAKTLRSVHLAHASTIPFENLDIQLGRLPIRLDIPSLQAKLVAGGRGGYCFEQNTLFAAALEALGFPVTRLAARVRMGSTEPRPRSHMLLRVEADGEPWLADVGFGGEGLLEPLPMTPGRSSRQFGWTYRLADQGEFLVLQSLHGQGWFDLYAFTQEEHFAVDFEVSNHFTSTHPSSVFVQSLTVQLPTPEVRWVLRNRELFEMHGPDASPVIIDDDDELLRVLHERFGLEMPAGTNFRALGRAAARG